MPVHRIEFVGSRNATLVGRLELPETTPRGWALFAHCFTCSSNSKAAVYIARAMVEAGFGVLRFDFTGLGGSQGDFANTNFSSNVDDLVAAADWLRANHGAPELLIGHSLGGSAVLAAAHRIEDATAVATIAAPFDPAHVVNQFGEQRQQIQEEGEATVTLGGQSFIVRKSFLEDLGSQRQANRIHKLRRALLILHPPGDKIVSIDNATSIFQAALHPKSFVSLDNADHLLTRERDARYAAGVIAAWAERYLTEAEADRWSGQETSATSTENAEADDSIYVTERGTGQFAVAITAGRHSWVGDEPKSVGGDDAGPNPYQMLTAALGACTAMTMRMYARHKEWPLTNVAVRLKHEKIYAKDCAECETRSGKIDRIERWIRIEGELDADQRARLMEIADKCPVHRTLHSEVQVVTHSEDTGKATLE